MADSALSLADLFEPEEVSNWTERLGERARRFVCDTVDGVTTQPLYGAEDQPATEARWVRAHAGWELRTLVGHPDVDVAVDWIRQDCENGAAGLWLSLGIERGTRVLTPGDVAALLESVPLPDCSLSIEAGAEVLPMTAAVLAVAKSRHVDFGGLRGSWGCDPLGTLAETGSLPVGLQGAVWGMRELVAFSRTRTPQMRAIHVSSTPYAEAGATASQQLGWMLATAVDYLRMLGEDDHPTSEIMRQLQFVTTVGSDVFLEIAKLRAMRQLWAKVLAGLGAADEMDATRIHAHTARSSLSSRDPWVNVVRGTGAAFAAAVGGADSVSVVPFDGSVGGPSALSTRIARNTQHLLADESHLSAVVDPAGGSYYVEALTGQLAEQAWRVFREAEAAGGMTKALLRGRVRTAVGEAVRARRRALEEGRQTVVGASRFAELEEAPIEREAVSMRDVEGRLGREFVNDAPTDQRYASIVTFAETMAQANGSTGTAMQAAVDAVARGVDMYSIMTLLGTGRPSLHVEPMLPWVASEAWEQLYVASQTWARIKGRRPTGLFISRPDGQGDFEEARALLATAGLKLARAEGANAEFDPEAHDFVVVSGDWPVAETAISRTRTEGARAVVWFGDLGDLGNLGDSIRAGVDVVVEPGERRLEDLRALQARLGV